VLPPAWLINLSAFVSDAGYLQAIHLQHRRICMSSVTDAQTCLL
jgi:hypothetical protein